MGFFDRFKKKASDTPSGPVVLAAVAKAPWSKCRISPMRFSPRGFWASGCGIDLKSERFMPPATARSPRRRIRCMRSAWRGDGGVECCLHVGVDTVEMKGDGFSPMSSSATMSAKGRSCSRWTWIKSRQPATRLLSSRL